ncbi:MAG: non-ribosomal peptide synthetase, partial [Acidobacteria bacterium]|nr:non-ribosomal peptide synthetase [Acidobacteriota bacterium]
GVDHLWLTAGLFHQMVEGPLDKLRGLRRLLAGGDVLSPGHVKKALETLPDTTVINGYGPTENTTFTTTHAMDDAAAVGDPVPIGRPISNTRVYVLDARRRPVPVGIAGELYAGGDGLARGYHRRPAATAERFVPDPGLGAEPGARLYKTGDLVRWLPSGVLEFLGRTDQQVKVRGFRIEPGEIEAALLRHPGVAECAVIARSDGTADAPSATSTASTTAGAKRLVAYLVPGDGQDLGEVDWRSFLRRDLPDYLVPSAFVVLETLPLNANGKLDRAALPAPESSGGGEGREPETELERYLVELWQELLPVETVGVDDDFFELGGHSLVATQVISRLRQGRSLEAPLGLLFEHPTVAQLAAALDELQAGGDGASGPSAITAALGAGEIAIPEGAEDLSEEDLDALLRSMMDGEEGA